MSMLRSKLQELLTEELVLYPSSSSTTPTTTSSDNNKTVLSTESFAYKICQECLRHLRECASLSAHWASGFIFLPDGTLRLNTLKSETKKKPNILLGSWLLDLLLGHSKCSLYVRNVFFVDIYDALLQYVSTKTTPSKGRLFPLLTRLLKELGGFPNERDLQSPEWKALEDQMKNLYGTEKNSGSALSSYCLQRLIELLILRRTILKENEEKDAAKKKLLEIGGGGEDSKEKEPSTTDKKWEVALEPMEGDDGAGTVDWFDSILIEVTTLARLLREEPLVVSA